MSEIDAELDAAIAAIGDPERMRAAQELVAKAAPALQRVLASALADGGWFDTAHEAAVREAVAADGEEEVLSNRETSHFKGSSGNARLRVLAGSGVAANHLSLAV